MKCKEFEEMIPNFVANNLDYAVTNQFLEHWNSCKLCKEELNIQFLVNEGLVRLEEGEAFDLQKEMHDLLGEARKKVRIHEKILRWGRRFEIVFMLAIMAVVICIMVL